MQRLRFSVASLLLLATTTILSPGSRAGPVVAAGFDEERSAVNWAVQRFEQAGLVAPTVTVSFHQARDGCLGHPGLFRDVPAPQVDVCVASVLDTAGRKTLLHELSHAWSHQFLTNEQRDQFVAMRALPVWADNETPWELQGIEHAAEILSWALFDRELDLVTIPDADLESVSAAYRLLTGLDLPDR